MDNFFGNKECKIFRCILNRGAFRLGGRKSGHYTVPGRFRANDPDSKNLKEKKRVKLCESGERDKRRGK